ncbi:MAG: Do family serine endopeptidase, partial [Pyrinomonadaceae bacterium]|nr:Do family serine endopeptidase [Pyrinomonadaceae bacterium]
MSKNFVVRFSSIQVLSLSLFAVFALSGCGSLPGVISTSTPTQASNGQNQQNIAPIVLADGIRTSYADIVERVAPAVVAIRAERRVTAEDSQNPLTSDPRFRQFFPNQQSQRPQVERGIGSGVIINNDGTILTNNHVVEGATKINVDLTDKRSFVAKVVGTDAGSDLAVLKIEAENLPVLGLGDSDKVRVGDIVLAIGNPLGLAQTVTSGIISGKGRSTGISTDSFEDFLQTDAPINRGNSGGALVSLNGELVGINSQILSSGNGGGSIGIGFAIPSNMAKGISEQLLNGGKVKRGQLGVGIQNINSDNAAQFDLKEVRGVLVNRVLPDSAADKAGIKQGDVILAINGERVDDGNTLRNRVAGTKPDSEISVTISRNGNQQDVKVTLSELSTERPDTQTLRPNELPKDKSSSNENSKQGLSLEQITPEIAKQLGLTTTATGLIVTAVNP